jgi:hypothetical protein
MAKLVWAVGALHCPTHEGDIRTSGKKSPFGRKDQGAALRVLSHRFDFTLQRPQCFIIERIGRRLVKVKGVDPLRVFLQIKHK